MLFAAVMFLITGFIAVEYWDDLDTESIINNTKRPSKLLKYVGLTMIVISWLLFYIALK